MAVSNCTRRSLLVNMRYLNRLILACPTGQAVVGRVDTGCQPAAGKPAESPDEGSVAHRARLWLFALRVGYPTQPIASDMFLSSVWSSNQALTLALARLERFTQRVPLG
jgi:hypothetical protein